MIRRLLLSHLTLVLLVLAALAIPLGYVFQSSEQQQALRQLEREAEVLASYVDAELDEADAHGAEQIARASAERWRGRVELFDATGGLVFSTAPPPAGVSLMSAQVPVNPGKPGLGAVRVSVPSRTLLAQVQQFWVLLGVASVAVLALSVAVAYALATWIGKPVRVLEHATRRLADDTGPAVVPGAAGPPELRRLAETFNRTAARLHSVLEARGSFVEHASHQLKSPLAALRLRLENLEPDVAPAGVANLDAALGETERLDKLVNTLLDLTLIERREETPEPVDLAAEAVERAEIWQPLAAERGVTVVARTGEPVWGSAVSGSVEQILDNLISNALNVAPSGSEITLTAVRSGAGRVELHVTDAGPGLPDGQREQALEPFWRAPGAPKGGSGLGLALVRKLAEADGGGIRLDPTTPTGIDAVVTLPSS
ncbi:MAG TPA: HAMP domain-containing sensor histidine kinase [Actinoplanes sp.]|nr:HAMP domain-containing sensor histidine kinase [Actinoplanes sp.]